MKKRDFLKLVFVFLFVSAGTFIYWLIYERSLIGTDDANIYFIYMRNLAEGHGFVYNIGGEKVEGFTSLLWTLTGSLFFKFTSEPEIFLLLFNVFIITVMLWQLILFADKIFNDTRAFSPSTYFILGCLLLLPGYFDWALLSLMETGFWSFLLVMTAVVLARFEFVNENFRRNNLIFSVLMILLVLCRPESFLWGAFFLLIRYWQLRRKQITRRNIFLPLTCFFIAAASLILWRLWYFGYPLPNTYYAKISSDLAGNLIAGLKYDYHFFKDHSFLLLIFCAGLIYFFDATGRKVVGEKNYIPVILLSSIIVSLAVPLYSGGDHFYAARFIQPIVPLFYFLSVILITYYFSSVKSRIYLVITISLFALSFSPAYHLINYFLNEGQIRVEFKIAWEGRAMGKKLNTFFSDCHPMPSNGILLAGAEAFVYKGTSVDVLGLNTVSIAHAQRTKSGIKNHASFDKKSFYELAPDIFSTTEFVRDTANFIILEKHPLYNTGWLELYKGIFAEEEFRETYLPVFIFKKGSRDILHTYANKNFLGRLNSGHYSYTIIRR
jgi:arabinofuranosyltransferase